MQPGNISVPKQNGPNVDSLRNVQKIKQLQPAKGKKIQQAILNKKAVKAPVEKIQQGQREVDKVVDELNKQLKDRNTRLSFSYDDENNLTLIQVRDNKTGDIIKQLPSDEMLNSQKKISKLLGILVDQSI